jgi:hypothetical protein
MNNERCIRLLTAERDALKRIIELEARKAATAGGDAQPTSDFVVRRTNVVEAYDYAIKRLRDG